MEKEQEQLQAIIQSETTSVPYKPVSKGQSLEVYVPRNMAFEFQKSLNEIEKNHGNLDMFLRQKLGYSSLSELYGALSAEQIDAAALAITNIERGEGMIVGDMTGIGKGRIAASVIRYSVKHGFRPVFLTEKSNLFSDIYRDLKSIGSDNLVPLIINGDEEADIKDLNPKTEKLEVVYKHLSSQGLKNRIEGENDVPRDYHFVCATYSQFNQDWHAALGRSLSGAGSRPKTAPKSQFKSDFLRAISRDNIFILDEAHNAGGLDSTIGWYLREILEKTRGVLFLSATFAKRADNLPLYAVKTVMKEANLSSAGLINSIVEGGVALQEIIAANLVEAGQMVRRERTFEGIKIEYNELPHLKSEHAEIFDQVTEIIREIIDFQEKYVKPIIKEMDKQTKEEEGATTETASGTSMAGVDNAPFVSKVFNIIDQLLFAIKADAVADEAIAALRENKKPIIAFKSTMGSFLEELGIAEGELIENTDFTLTFKKSLSTVMRYTVKDAMGNSKTTEFGPEDLGAKGEQKYNELIDKIESAASGISISPIDQIINRIQKAGYALGEVTGRNQRIRFNADGKTGTIENYKAKKNEIFNKFNNGGTGKIDVVLLNQSGATGASLHASKDFKDQRTRVMIIHQIELNVNIEVQKRGRINRTGQVRKPEYKYVTTSIPAEKRLMMMMKNKMKSLDANTTGNQKSSDEALKSDDFLNKYGDDVVYKYLDENDELNKMLLDPLNLRNSDKELIKEGAANKVTGRVAILPTAMQEKFYKEVLIRYNAYITLLKQNDKYDLETAFEDLQAETLKKTIMVAGHGGRSAFGQDSVNELCSVNILRKPFTKKELDQQIEKAMDGQNPQVMARELISKYEEFYPAFKESKLAVVKRDMQEVREKLNEERQKENNGNKILRLENELKQLEGELVKRDEKLSHQYKSIKEMFEFFKIGRVLNVIYQEEFEDYSKGVFLGFDIDYSRDNPYAPSSMILNIATADSRRRLTLPASQSSFVNQIIAKSFNIPPKEIEDTFKYWDKTTSNKTREQRYILTGNILQGLGHIKGKLIKFTTKAGEIKNGIKLNESFGEEESDFESTVPISKAIKLIENLKVGEEIFTSNEEVKFISKNLDFYEIRVPKSNSKGGRFYTDEDLRKLVAKEKGSKDELGTFTSVGQEMSAMLHKTKLKEFVQILNDKFKLSMKTDAIIITEEDKQTRTQREFEFILTKPFGIGSYPPVGFLKHIPEKGEFGHVVYDRDLDIKLRLNFSLIPVFKAALDPVEKWMKELSPLQKEKLEELTKSLKKADDYTKIVKLSNYMLTTNVIGNPEFTFGEYSDKELASAFAEKEKISLEGKGFLKLSVLIKQLKMVTL